MLWGPTLFRPEEPKRPTTGQGRDLLCLPLSKVRPQIWSWHHVPSTGEERAMWGEGKRSSPQCLCSAPGSSWVGARRSGGLVGRKGDNVRGSRHSFRSSLSLTLEASHSPSQPLTSFCIPLSPLVSPLVSMCPSALLSCHLLSMSYLGMSPAPRDSTTIYPLMTFKTVFLTQVDELRLSMF